MKAPKTVLETKATTAQLAARESLLSLFQSRPMAEEDYLVNVGLYTRSAVLVKLLFLQELYVLIKDIPGCILECGTWWGQNLAVWENLRAIYEPFNQTRRIIGFDTFTGYAGMSNKDVHSGDVGFHTFAEVIKPGQYAVTPGYAEHLRQVLAAHEGINVLSTVKKHSVIEGDVRETVPAFFAKHPETVVALAYCDLALYETTKMCLETLAPYLIPGSVVVLDELNYPEAPGETLAYREVFRVIPHRLHVSQFIRDKTILVVL